MALVAVVASAIALVSAVLSALVARRGRQTVHQLMVELASQQLVNAAVMARLAALAPCEVCGRPLAEGDTATVRLGPRGYDVVAHGLCLGPMPGQRQGY